ncbi:hypothetical protein JQK15_05630 [Sphingobium sp. BHU LFT2]|nr:hypothetical protein [Sphingobium sp. BHU LFT2]MBT2243012.1 hypothetical protein [Sphingobium sp. BHU LFT2]
MSDDDPLAAWSRYCADPDPDAHDADVMLGIPLTDEEAISIPDLGIF